MLKALHNALESHCSCHQALSKHLMKHSALLNLRTTFKFFSLV